MLPYLFMAVQKLSVAIDERVAEAASKSAARHGLSLSAWLSRAARNELALEDGLRAVAEWEAEYGALSDEELAQADAVLDGTE